MPFSRLFNRIPVVMTSIITANEVDPVMSRIQSVMKSDLRVALHGGDSATHASSLVSLSYIAWEPVVGTLQSITFEVQRAQDVGRGEWHTLEFITI